MSQPLTPEEQKIKSLWIALQVAKKQNEKRGLQFGESMYEYREKHWAQGRRRDLNLVTDVTKSETFEEFCERLSIVRMTAYRWIARHEETIGERPSKSSVPEPLSPEPEPESPEPTPAFAPLVTGEAPVRVRARRSCSTGLRCRRESLAHLTKRFVSLSKAVQQILSDKDRWSQHAEYAETLSTSKTLASLIQQL